MKGILYHRKKYRQLYNHHHTMSNLLDRITINPEVSSGMPSIRNMRFTVSQMLELLASGMTHEEILGDYPYIEEDDIKAVLLYTSRFSEFKSTVPH